jgi:DNA-binding Lrp family transcriptional regulator
LAAAVDTTAGRYARGVQRLNPALVERLQAELRAEPTISKAELARRVQASRATVGYYLRRLQDDVHDAATRNGAVRERAALSQLDLVQRVAEAADEVRAEIGKLRAAPGGTSNPSVTFRGYGVLTQLLRLLAELVGEIAPVQNTYVLQVQALLQRPVAVAELSPTARAALRVDDHGTAAPR